MAAGRVASWPRARERLTMLAVRTAHRSEAAVGAAGAQCEAGCVVERHLQCTRTCTVTCSAHARVHARCTGRTRSARVDPWVISPRRTERGGSIPTGAKCARASTQCPMHVPMQCPCCAHAVPRGMQMPMPMPMPMQMQMQMQMQTQTRPPEADVGMRYRSRLPWLTALGLTPVSSHAPCRGCSGVPAQARSPTCVRG